MADNNNPVEENAPPNGIQVNARDRLFHAIFIKAAAVYIRVVPKWCRGLFEVIVLAKALVLFTTLSYIHFTFSKNPMDCLDKFKDNWPREGILQVQIMKERQNTSVEKSKLPLYFASEWNHSFVMNTAKESNQCGIHDYYDAEKHSNTSENASEIMKGNRRHNFVNIVDNKYLMKRETVFIEKAFVNPKSQEDQAYFPNMQQFVQFYGNKQIKNHYIMEYSLEYGFLRLSTEARKKVNVPVKVVTLDPKVDKCFGDSLSRFILDKFLGYDDLLMASIKKLAEKEGNKGYMKNVLTGEHYKFVTMWMGRTSYAVSLLLMFVFTIAISTLLRFCHQQIFIFIVHLLQVMDWNASLTFPVAPLFTVILSLVGMEAIMAEFFNDTTTSFYIILIVWAADQFDSICCHTRLSQKYWLRFFYLYHFLFYGYHYRFNGQYSSIALAASWFFIQHSMLYFLHNYEIPAIEAALNAQGVNYLDDAVDLLVDEMQFPLVPENASIPLNAESDGHQMAEQTHAIDQGGSEEGGIANEAASAQNQGNASGIEMNGFATEENQATGTRNDENVNQEMVLSNEIYLQANEQAIGEDGMRVVAPLQRKKASLGQRGMAGYGGKEGKEENSTEQSGDGPSNASTAFWCTNMQMGIRNKEENRNVATEAGEEFNDCENNPTHAGTSADRIVNFEKSDRNPFYQQIACASSSNEINTNKSLCSNGDKLGKDIKNSSSHADNKFGKETPT